MKRILALAVIALLAIATSARAEQNVIATLTAYDGALDIVRTGIALSLYPEMPLVSGDVVHTRNGRATIRFEDQSEIRVRAHTRLAISERKERRDIDVFFGRLWAFVARQQDKQTAFKSGGTIAAVRGTRLEFSAKLNGQVDVGVLEGLLEIFFNKPGGGTASSLLGAGLRRRIGADGSSSESPFKEGDIANSDPAGAGAEAAPPAEAKEAATPEASKSEDSAAAQPAAATAPPEPAARNTVPEPPAAAPEPPAAAPEQPAVPPPAPAAATESVPEEAEPEKQTQGGYAIRLINALGIAQNLPVNATARDAMDYLARLGLSPCSGRWEEEKEIDLNDLLCIAGIDPNDPLAPLTISQEELIAKILEKYGELFWLQTRRKQSVSPFAP